MLGIPDDVLQWLDGLGKTAGFAGGAVAAEIYRRFRGSIKASKNALAAAKAAQEAIAAHDAAIRRDMASLEAVLKGYVTEQISRLQRGSLVEIQNGPDAIRIADLARRISQLEDQLDERTNADAEAWQEIRRAVAYIEGALKLPR